MKTRKFFKTLIGNHFHFTAAGIDWIDERWLEGSPPTYQEFATFWQKKYEEDQLSRSKPKDEWAYIRFTQNHLTVNPSAPKREITKAWKEEQQKQVRLALNIIDNLLTEMT